MPKNGKRAATDRAARAIDWGGFLALELVRLNKLDMGQVREILEEFRRRDREKNQRITWRELEEYHYERLVRLVHERHLVRTQGISPTRARAKASQLEAAKVHAFGREIEQNRVVADNADPGV